MSNNPPDVILELTHEQATFLLENCLSNRHLGLAMIMSIAEDKGTLEEKRERSQRFVELNEKFGEIMKLLMRAGARRADDV